MVCDIIKPAGSPENSPSNNWEYRQDTDSGAILKRWVDDPDTNSDEVRPGLLVRDVPLIARGVIDGGIRVAGTTERFSEVYQNIDWVRAVFPGNISITKRDQVGNIRNKRGGKLLWREEESTGFPATRFNVMGVTPVFDPFNNLIEQAVLLERADVQRG